MKTRKIKNYKPYTSLINETCDTPAWRALSHGARVLYAALKREHNPGVQARWNGRIHLSVRDAAERVGSKRDQIIRWYRELEHYGFIVMASPGCLGLNGKGKATKWRLTELKTEADGAAPTNDFMHWKGVKFHSSKKQNPGPESGTTVVPKVGPVAVPKVGPPKASSGPEIGTKGNRPSGPEIGTIITLTIPSPIVGEPDASGVVQLRQRMVEADQVDEADAAITKGSKQ